MKNVVDEVLLLMKDVFKFDKETEEKLKKDFNSPVELMLKEGNYSLTKGECSTKNKL